MARRLLVQAAVTEIDIPLGLLAVLRPECVRPLGALGIDLTLEHARPFDEACAMRDIDPDWAMLHVLNSTDDACQTTRSADWSILRNALAPRAWDLDALV